MKNLRSSRIRAIGRLLQNPTSFDTQVVSFSVDAKESNCVINYAPYNTPLPFLFKYCNVDYPRPDCNNNDTSNGITPTCKAALQKISDLPVNLKIFLQTQKLID